MGSGPAPHSESPHSEHILGKRVGGRREGWIGGSFWITLNRMRPTKWHYRLEVEAGRVVLSREMGSKRLIAVVLA